MSIKHLMYDLDTLKNKKNLKDKIEWIKCCVSWKFYSLLNLGFAVKIKIYVASALAKLGLRKPVDLEIDFPERDWDTDIYH